LQNLIHSIENYTTQIQDDIKETVNWQNDFISFRIVVSNRQFSFNLKVWWVASKFCWHWL
jgi:hypothetical protein